METTVNLTDQEWNIVHAIARDLSLSDTDPNEVKKILEYLRKFQSKNFFQYLKILAKNSDRVRHSKKTVAYYSAIETACKKHLQEYQDQPQLMLNILGWTTRLMGYYKTSPQAEKEIKDKPQKSERQAKIEKYSSSLEFKEGQVIEATVVGFSKGNKVTYEITANTQKLTQKEPKKFNLLSEGQKVKVEITRLEEGKIKKVKCVDP